MVNSLCPVGTKSKRSFGATKDGPRGHLKGQKVGWGELHNGYSLSLAADEALALLRDGKAGVVAPSCFFLRHPPSPVDFHSPFGRMRAKKHEKGVVCLERNQAMIIGVNWYRIVEPLVLVESSGKPAPKERQSGPLEVHFSGHSGAKPTHKREPFLGLTTCGSQRGKGCYMTQ